MNQRQDEQFSCPKRCRIATELERWHRNRWNPIVQSRRCVNKVSPRIQRNAIRPWEPVAANGGEAKAPIKCATKSQTGVPNPSASTRRCCWSVCAQEPAFPDLGSRLKRNLPIDSESCCRSCAHLTTTEHVRDSSADLGTAAQAPSSLHGRLYAERESALSAAAKSGA